MLTRYAAAFGIGCLIATTALAQSEPVEPHSKLAAKAWAETIMRGTDTRTIIGKPVIAVVNATGSGIEKITCQYKNKSWQLVGDSPYNSDNPHNIPAWKETEIDTTGFDDYCPVITATTRDGDVVEGLIFVTPTGGSAAIAAASNFTAAAFLVFPPPK